MNKFTFSSFILFFSFLVSFQVFAQENWLYSFEYKGFTKKFNYRDIVIEHYKIKNVQGKIKITNPLWANYSRFKKTVQIENLEFEAEVDFAHSIFDKHTTFQNVYFHQEVNFSDARFLSCVDFTKVTFNKGVNFKHAYLPDTLVLKDLNLKRLKGRIDLTKTFRRSGGCLIDLRGTDLSKISFNYNNGFKLYLNGLSDKEKEVLYQKLLAQQKKFDFKSGYDTALSEYNTYKHLKKLKEKAGRPNYQQAGVLILIILLAIAVVYITKWQSAKTANKAIQPTIKSATIVSSPAVNYSKKETIFEDKVRATLQESVKLWAAYQTPEDLLNEPDEFWVKYEKLLTKMKDV